MNLQYPEQRQGHKQPLNSICWINECFQLHLQAWYWISHFGCYVLHFQEELILVLHVLPFQNILFLFCKSNISSFLSEYMNHGFTLRVAACMVPVTSKTPLSICLGLSFLCERPSSNVWGSLAVHSLKSVMPLGSYLCMCDMNGELCGLGGDQPPEGAPVHPYLKAFSLCCQNSEGRGTGGLFSLQAFT